MGLNDVSRQAIPDQRSAIGELVIDGRAVTLALEQVAPGRARPQHPENAVQNAPAIDPRNPACLIGGSRERILTNTILRGQGIAFADRPT
jgi:hypothetical protein